MSVDEQFNKAAQDVMNLKQTPSNQDALEIYSLYKQAIVGDCNTARPNALDVQGRAKWDAWNAKKGMAQSEAKEAYVKKASELIANLGLN